MGAFALLLALLSLVPSLALAKDESYPQNYKTQIHAVKPAVQGLKIGTEGGDRFLVLTNETGKTVLVAGYDGDQYLRFLPNREVDVNVNSPTKYLNEDRFGTINVPASATPGAAPKWQRVSDSGSYRWFDHRIHWMERKPPPQVKDQSKQTKIFDWEVPVKVAGAQVSASGTLLWIPDSSSSGLSTGAIVAIVAGVLVLLALLAFLFLRRRREPAASAPREKASKEAW